MVLRALSKDRDRRFPSAGAMADAIDAVLSGAETLPAAPRPPAGSASKLPWIWAMGAALLLVLLWAAWPSGKDEVSTPEARLEEILARGTLVPDEDLDPFVSNPDHRRRIADHFLGHGQFGRAFEYLEDYDRAIVQMASAGALQRFVSPGLFPAWMDVPEGVK